MEELQEEAPQVNPLPEDAPVILSEDKYPVWKAFKEHQDALKGRIDEKNKKNSESSSNRATIGTHTRVSLPLYMDPRMPNEWNAMMRSLETYGSALMARIGHEEAVEHYREARPEEISKPQEFTATRYPDPNARDQLKRRTDQLMKLADTEYEASIRSLKKQTQEPSLQEKGKVDATRRASPEYLDQL